MSNLKQQLEQVTAKLNKKLPEEFRKATSKAIEELTQSEAIKGLSVGRLAPNFVLPDATGKRIALSDLLKNGPVVLSFYRGSW